MSGAPSTERGVIRGAVTWVSTSTVGDVHVARDRHVCGKSGPIPERQIEVDALGRLRNAIVYIDGEKKSSSLKPRTLRIDQKNCTFVPVASATTLGSTLRITSSDPVLHNVHVRDRSGKTVANWAMPVMGQEIAVELKTAGEFTLVCEAGHGWMRASVHVFEHDRFATTGPDGRFEIREVAPGTHRVIAWHPEIGRVERSVVVPENGNTPVDIAFELRDDVSFSRVTR